MDAIVAELVIGAFALAILLMEALLSPRQQTRSMGYFSLMGCLMALAVALGRWGSDSGEWQGLAGDSFAAYCEVILLASGALSLLITLAGPTPPRGATCALVLVVTLGMMIAATATNLLVLFLGMELGFISLQILSMSATVTARSAEAGVKLTFASAFASGFFILGFACLYGATGATSFGALAAALMNESGSLALAGMALLLVALGLRLGIVPFHLWLPDVWQGVALPVTALMSSTVAAATLAATMRLLAIGLEPLQVMWMPLITASAMITMTVGSLLAATERNLKRALAGAGIAHVGFVLSGLVAVDSGGLGAVAFSLVVVILFNLGVYGALSLFAAPESASVTIDDFRGLGRRQPLIAFAFASLLLGLAALPPGGGFAARLWLAEAALEGSNLLSGIVVVNTLVTAYLYLRLMARMFMAPPAADCMAVRLTAEAVTTVALTVAAGIALGLWPAPVMEFAHDATQALIR